MVDQYCKGTTPKKMHKLEKRIEELSGKLEIKGTQQWVDFNNAINKKT